MCAEKRVCYHLSMQLCCIVMCIADYGSWITCEKKLSDERDSSGFVTTHYHVFSLEEGERARLT